MRRLDVGWQKVKSEKPDRYGITGYSGSTGVLVGSLVYFMYGTINHRPDSPWGHVLDYARNAWKALYNKPGSEKAPTLRERSSLTLVGTDLYSFGGRLGNQQYEHDDTITAFDLVLEEWRTLTTTGDSPSLEDDSYHPFGHYMEDDSSILYLVGRYMDFKYSNYDYGYTTHGAIQLFLLNLNNLCWSKPGAKGRPPNALDGQICAANGKLFVLPPAHRHPLFILSLSRPFTWTNLGVQNYASSDHMLTIPRLHGHLLYLPKWGRLLLLGGQNETITRANEFFFNPKSNTWKEREEDSGILKRLQKATWASFPPIVWHGACISTTECILYIDYEMVEKDGTYYKVHISESKQE